MLLPRTALVGLAAAILLIFLSSASPYGSLLMLWYLGFLSMRGFELETRLLLGPAAGFVVAIILMHAVSFTGLSLSTVVFVAYFLLLILSATENWEEALNFGRIDRFAVAILIFSVLFSAGMKLPFLQIPSYPGGVGSDSIFHAYKSQEILAEGTVFIKRNPLNLPMFLSYPAGYHSLIAFISLASGSTVPLSMKALKLFVWILLPLGTYALGKGILGRRAGLAAASLMPLSYMFYYYLNYALQHMFLDYYLLLSALTVVQGIKRKLSLLLWGSLLAFSVLVVHPYVYLLFIAYVGFLALLSPLEGRQKLWLYATVIAASLVLYFALEYPMRLPVGHYAGPIFSRPAYSFKDNPHWFAWILRETFWNHGQFVLLPFYVVGIFALRRRGFPLLLTLAYDLFLVLNKIWFHVPVPYYSSIWSSERVYVLITPLLPIVSGAGMSVTFSVVGFRRKFLAGIIALLIIPAFYVNLSNYSHEECSVLSGPALNAMSFIGRRIDEGTIYIDNFKDSGYWIPLMTGKRIIRVSTPPERGVLYVDGRGYGDLHVNPINPLEAWKRGSLLYYHGNIWLFRIPGSGDNPAALRNLTAELSLRDTTINAKKRSDWRYFIYGFLLRHPAVLEGMILGEWNGVFSMRNTSYIMFIPLRNYTSLSIEGLGENASVYLNGLLIGALGRRITFKGRIRAGRPCIIKFEGDVMIKGIILS
ncbi:hypothetical protein [Thermococcus sp.]